MKKTIYGVILAAIGLMLSFGAYAAPVSLGDPLSATQADGTWYTDRYAPNIFSYDSGSGVLSQRIDASDGASARPAAYSSSFYNTQGRKHDLPVGTTSLSIEWYAAGDPLQQRIAGLWGTAVNAADVISFYPILEFATDGAGPRVQGWNGGGFDSYALPTSFAYDVWHELEIALNGSNWDYLLDGALLGSVDANGSVGLDNGILQGYNNFTGATGNYEIQWRNLQAGPDNRIPEPSSMALLLVGFSGLLVARRKTLGTTKK
jgi:hypothetical protein